jgi:peptidoglycan hydrolase CwlO-like protein
MSSSEKYPAWLVGIVSVVLLAATGAIGTWVGTTLAAHGEQLNDHDRSIANHEARLSHGEKATDRIEDKIDRILEKLTK